MKAFLGIRAFSVSISHVERLEAILETKSRGPRFPGFNSLFVDFELEESRSIDLGCFEEYCRQNNLQFWKLRRRSYSKAEIEAAEFFMLVDEMVGSDTDTTQYSSQKVCRTCGVGLTQAGPLIIKFDRPTIKKLFCVSLRQSTGWVITPEASQLFEHFIGFHFGRVSGPADPKKWLEHLKQLVVENYLPRMATITKFSECDPPMKNRCVCNRAGWNLTNEKIYERSALRNAEDINLTVERWHGGGIAGLNWLVVSQRVRRAILDNRLLSPSCFDPIRVIEHDPGDHYQFEIPLDAAESGNVS